MKDRKTTERKLYIHIQGKKALVCEAICIAILCKRLFSNLSFVLLSLRHLLYRRVCSVPVLSVYVCQGDCPISHFDARLTYHRESVYHAELTRYHQKLCKLGYFHKNILADTWPYGPSGYSYILFFFYPKQNDLYNNFYQTVWNFSTVLGFLL